MIPDVVPEEPGIDKVGYELAGQLICHLDEVEKTAAARLETFIETCNTVTM